MYHITIQSTVITNDYVPSVSKMKHWASLALRQQVRRAELTILLVDKNEIKQLNKTYRHKNKPTNVLSFKADLLPQVKLKIPLLGDMVICPNIVNQEAQAQGKTYQAHWAHIVIHGTLHLLGYDHELKKEAQQMEAREIRLLKKLGFSNPYE